MCFKLVTTVLCLDLLLVWGMGFPMQGKDSANPQESCLRFVQSFYDWYATNALGKKGIIASDYALEHKSQVFSPELLRALKQDADAQAKARGVIVGIDFDPFVGSQDPAEKYKVGVIRQKDDRYLVEVYGIYDGSPNQTPDVRAELVQTSGTWVLVNFYYPPVSGNLLDVLRLLRDDRQKH